MISISMPGRWGSTTEAEKQTNSSADSLMCRHLPSSFPSTPGVEKAFIDLYCTGDSWNHKKWMVGVSGRPTVLAVTQLPFWCHVPTALLPHPSRSQRDRGKELHMRPCTANTSPTSNTAHTSPPFQPNTAKPLWVPSTPYTIAFTEKESSVWGWQEQR